MEQLSNIEIPFRFTARPAPLPGDLRPAWRIGLILVILKYSRGQKATLQKLHLLNTVSRTEETRDAYLRYVRGAARKDEIIPRIEPGLNRALNLARGEGLIEIEKGKNIKLTSAGLNAATQIDGADCFQAEKSFLGAIKAFSTEGNVEDLFNWSAML